jgi:hypothetical protein
VATNRLHVRQMTWLPGTRTFSAELSEVRGFEPAQIYRDAADVGLVLEGRTGKEVTYAFAREDRFGEQVMGWRFVPTPESLRAVPRARGTSVLIIND